MLAIALKVVGVLVALVVGVVLWVMSGKPRHRMEGKQRVLTSLPTQAYVFGMAIKKSLFAKKLRNAVVLPDVSIVQNDIEVRASHVAKYRDICGFDVKGDATPLTYPYLLIFPLQGLLLVDKSFPFQAMGVVHLANRIQQFGAIATGSKVTASVKFDPVVEPHAKGYCFKVVSEIFSSSKQSELLWRCESTYLFRSRNTTLATGVMYASKLEEKHMQEMTTGKNWALSADFGRKYAAVSGDYNPIHLYAFTAKLFGFPHGCIMHGMWSIAACTAALMPDISAAAASSSSAVGKTPIAEMYAEMKLPMYLPNKPILQQKSVTTAKCPEKTACKNARVFEMDMNMRKQSEPVPHLKGWCAWD